MDEGRLLIKNRQSANQFDEVSLFLKNLVLERSKGNYTCLEVKNGVRGLRFIFTTYNLQQNDGKTVRIRGLIRKSEYTEHQGLRLHSLF